MSQGKVNGIPITFGSIYAPPGSNFAFYRNIFHLIIGAKGIMIYGGDWNICLNPELDSSKSTNDTGEVEPAMVWDALKPVISGKIVSICAYDEEEKQSKLMEFNKELKDHETQHKREQMPDLMAKIKKIRNEINILYSGEIGKKYDLYQTKIL